MATPLDRGREVGLIAISGVSDCSNQRSSKQRTSLLLRDIDQSATATLPTDRNVSVASPVGGMLVIQVELLLVRRFEHRRPLLEVSPLHR